MLIRIVLIFLFIIFKVNGKDLEYCKWNNTKGIPCLVLSKTPNSSEYSETGISKTVITKKDIYKSGALDTSDVLKLVPGLDIFQSGQKGQQTSIFTRGSESNHTLVLLNGVAINDQSVTDGLHDFGQDFVQTIQQIEVYKGSNGVHFGPSAIAGAINFITDVDYTNSYSVNGFDEKNNSIDVNYTKIIDNGWHMNIKGASTKSKTDSAIAKGNEEDGAKNYQLNINLKKWIKDDLKFTNTLYSRKTEADYDSSASKETGYISDNKMYALQSSLENKTKNSENILLFHYHNYDRKYDNAGFLDEYYSNSIVTKLESKNITNKNLSLGYGSEYKYDWGDFENRGSYSASTKGHMKDFAIYANVGYKFNENQVFSIYGRSDDHNSTGKNQTYKLNFSQFFKKIKLGFTHSTGLRNPSLYELYGTDSNGFSGNRLLNPERSKTNEISSEYKFSKKLKFSSTAYRATIFDRIELNSSWSAYENKYTDLKQEGLESEFTYNNNSQKFSLFSHFAKSRTSTGGPQSRRPDFSYGLNYSKDYIANYFGKFNLFINYKYTGDYIDWDGSKNSFQKSTDIVDASLTKDWFGNKIYINITNLLNERYEKPATYSQNGRQFRIGFRKIY